MADARRRTSSRTISVKYKSKDWELQLENKRLVMICFLNEIMEHEFLQILQRYRNKGLFDKEPTVFMDMRLYNSV